MPVGIYVRISHDEEGDGKGVGRQERDGRALAAVRTNPDGSPMWRVHKVYCDNDLSAYQKGVRRPEWQQMMEDLESGVIRGVIVWKLDRFTRQPKELERAIDIWEEHPDYVFASVEGDINLSTPTGRAFARIIAAFARLASEDTAQRVERKMLERAEDGKGHGRVAYGWTPDDRNTVDPEAKREILAAHAQIHAGAKIADIQRDWIARGVAPRKANGDRYRSRKTKDQATPGPDHVSHKVIRDILTNPALAGLVVYRGETMKHPDGTPIQGEWETICTQAELDAVIAKLDERRRGRGRNALTYLLSSIARCGLCNHPMRGSSRPRTWGQDKGSRYTVYICNTTDGGCGKIGRNATELDELIINLVLADQARKARERTEQAPPAWDREGELMAAETEHAELMTAKEAGRVSMATVIALLAPLEATLRTLRGEKRRMEAERERVAVEADTRAAFDALTLEAKREQIRGSLSAVLVHPQGRGTRVFNPACIEPVWA